MTAQPLPPLPTGRWFDENGAPLVVFRTFMQALTRRVGGTTDKVDAASQTAIAAATQATQIVPGPGLQHGGPLTGNVGISLYWGKTTVAGLPTTGINVGDWAYATNARNSGEGAGAGTGCAVTWSGSVWRIPGVATAVTA